MTKADSGTERKAFKDWFDREAAKALAAQVRGAWPEFDARAFVRRATRDLNELEMAGRVNQFAASLREGLPPTIPRALQVLTRSLPPAMENCEAITDGWLQWPVGQFIADYATDHVEPAMRAMVALTKRFSSEFAVRPFVEADPAGMGARLLDLTGDANPHVRRWCSEGMRTRLPWGRKLHALIDDPAPIWPILEALRDDPERYVQRSVANNLNDLSKDHPKAVIARCKAWQRGATQARSWTMRHALRTLVKAGDPAALALTGFGPPRSLRASLGCAPTAIGIGESVVLELELTTHARSAQSLAVDYVVHYVRTRGKTSEKVFKWKTLELEPGGSVQLRKRHPMRPTTIRALYPGAHRIEVQVNGKRLAETSFVLKA